MTLTLPQWIYDGVPVASTATVALIHDRRNARLRVLPLLAAFGLALTTVACAYVERERPSRTVVQPAPSSSPPAVVVQPRY
jgi:hypothetical protein